MFIFGAWDGLLHKQRPPRRKVFLMCCWSVCAAICAVTLVLSFPGLHNLSARAVRSSHRLIGYSAGSKKTVSWVQLLREIPGRIISIPTLPLLLGRCLYREQHPKASPSPVLSRPSPICQVPQPPSRPPYGFHHHLELRRRHAPESSLSFHLLKQHTSRAVSIRSHGCSYMKRHLPPAPRTEKKSRPRSGDNAMSPSSLRRITPSDCPVPQRPLQSALGLLRNRSMSMLRNFCWNRQ